MRIKLSWKGNVPAGILCLVILLCCGCAAKVTSDPAAVLTGGQTLTEVRAVIRTGDWLVIRGIHGTDNLVAGATNSAFSHAAIYDAPGDRVIEAESVGIHATPLADFLGKSTRVMVLRPRWSTEYTAPKAVERAVSTLGKGYNFTGLIGLGLPDRWYCTELIIWAYEPFQDKGGNPIPHIIQPGRMYHWGRVIYDSGP